MKNHTFKHFDMAFYPFPLEEIIEKWQASGGNIQDLIEPVDGTLSKNSITNLLTLSS